MLLRGPDDATTRHLEGVAEDIRGLLGAGVDLQELVAAVEPKAALIHARYQLGEASGESIGRGENLIEAHAQLRAAIVVDRIGLGLRNLI
ncbi:MAG TPA: hypothetical protein VMQ65_10185 [Candidatus Limnocylindria bacterium]|nr:hypothetical protein [Candidatus Limnocylindria bacterium]